MGRNSLFRTVKFLGRHIGMFYQQPLKVFCGGGIIVKMCRRSSRSLQPFVLQPRCLLHRCARFSAGAAHNRNCSVHIKFVQKSLWDSHLLFIHGSGAHWWIKMMRNTIRDQPTPSCYVTERGQAFPARRRCTF